MVKKNQLKLLAALSASLLFSNTAQAWDKLNDAEKLGIGLAVIGTVKAMAANAQEEKNSIALDNQIVTSPQVKRLPENESLFGMFDWKLYDFFSLDNCINKPEKAFDRKGILKRNLMYASTCNISTKNHKYFNEASVLIDPITSRILAIEGIRTKAAYKTTTENDNYCFEQMNALRKILSDKYDLQSSRVSSNNSFATYSQRKNGQDYSADLRCFSGTDRTKLFNNDYVAITLQYAALNGLEQVEIDTKRLLSKKAAQNILDIVEDEADSF